jgi:hypothetical protein
MTGHESAKAPPRQRETPGSDPTPFFSLAVGVIVLPLYAAQPIIALIGASFRISVAAYGLIGMMSREMRACPNSRAETRCVRCEA